MLVKSAHLYNLDYQIKFWDNMNPIWDNTIPAVNGSKITGGIFSKSQSYYSIL